jgi:hypothetical protein
VSNSNPDNEENMETPGLVEQYNEREIERLWAHLLHEDNMVIQVSNFFWWGNRSC